jgi:hypothetical protein
MTLAKELAETNAILRQSAAESAAGRDALKHVDPEDPRWRPPRREPEPLRASELLLAIPDIGDVLREHFKDVPPKFWEMHEDKSRTVTCLCSAQTTIPFGGLHHCGCDRIFWNGSRGDPVREVARRNPLRALVRRRSLSLLRRPRDDR